MTDRTSAVAHVLLIEDDVNVGVGTVEALTYLGNEVDWARSANDAFAALSQPHLYEALVLDLGLGDCDGVTLIGTLRARGHALPPILVLSAWPAAALHHAVDEIGAVMGLQKPCGIKSLDAALRRTLSIAGA